MQILPLSVLLLALWAGCGREKRFQLPPDLGRGLPPADSLRTILNWLSQQKSYEAETLRFHYMYEYIRTLAHRSRIPFLPWCKRYGVGPRRVSIP
jgi:hypothetical protein